MIVDSTWLPDFWTAISIVGLVAIIIILIVYMRKK